MRSILALLFSASVVLAGNTQIKIRSEQGLPCKRAIRFEQEHQAGDKSIRGRISWAIFPIVIELKNRLEMKKWRYWKNLHIW